MAKLLQEFKEFAMKGSVIDLAVGIIIGTAFGAIVKSLVDDLIMPVVGVLLGGADFSNRFRIIHGGEGLPENATVESARASGAAVVAYGKFINNILTFLIVAIAVFLLVKAINKMRRKSQDEPMPTTRQCPECTTAIPKAARRCPSCTATVAPLTFRPRCASACRVTIMQPRPVASRRPSEPPISTGLPVTTAVTVWRTCME